MSILNVENLTHGFGDRAIFDHVSFLILNGCAKQETDLRSSNSHLGHTGMPGSKATGGYSEDITMAEIKEAVVVISFAALVSAPSCTKHT